MEERPFGRTDDERERQAIALAFEVAEERLRNRTASDALINHFLRLGASDYTLKRENLQRQNELMQAKVDDINRRRESDEVYKNAIAAMRKYSGHDDDEEIV